MGLEEAAQRVRARQDQAAMASAERDAKRRANVTAYDQAVAELNLLLQRFGDAIADKLVDYQREYRQPHMRVYRQTREARLKTFTSQHSVTAGIAIGFTGGDMHDGRIVLTGSGVRLTVCPSRDYWLVEVSRIEDGYTNYYPSLTHGPEELCHFNDAGGGRRQSKKDEYVAAWMSAPNYKQSIRESVEELVVIFLDHCGIPHSNATAPVAAVPTVRTIVARASVATPQASATAPQQITREQVYGTIVAINATVFGVGGILGCSGSALAGPWLGASVLGTLAFWGLRGLVYAFFNK